MNVHDSERLAGLLEAAGYRRAPDGHEADVVDMESSAVAAACARHGVNLGCVRVVSDDVSKPLSRRLMGLVEAGRVSKCQLTKTLLLSPPMVIELLRLAGDTRRAADRLDARKRRARLL